MLSHLSSSIWERFLFFSTIVIGPWCFVFFVRYFGPINHPQISIELVAFLVSIITTTYFSFCFGFSLSHSTHHRLSRLQMHASDDMGGIFRSVRFMVLCMAVAYPLVSFFDFLVVKGAAISAIVEQREAEHLTGPRNSLIGAIGALLSGAPPVLLAMMNLSRFKNMYINCIVYIFIILGFASMFLSGGRNAFFISMSFVFFCALFFSARPTKISKFSIRKLGAIAFVFYCIFFSMKMFLDRFEAQGLEVSFMLDYLELEYGVEIFRFDYNGDLFVAVYSALVYLSFYISHALTYLNEYFVTGYTPYMGGSYNFPQIARLIDVLFGSNFFDGGRERVILVGVYLTLPGSLYLDFGILGSVAICSLLGFYYGYLVRNFAQLAFYQKLCLTYVTVAMVFSPIYSIFGMANGFSLIFILLLTVFRSLRLRY